MSIEDSLSSNEEDVCVICLEGRENYTKPVSIHELNFQLFVKVCDCNYIVHPLCIMTWLDRKSECPMCRSDIKTPIALLQDINMLYSEPTETSNPVDNIEHIETTSTHTIIYNYQTYYILKWIIMSVSIPLLLLIIILLFTHL